MASSANPVLSQIETAVSNGALSAFTPSEELTKKYISKRKSQAFGIFFGSLALLFVALLVTWLLISRLHVIVFSAKIVVIFLFILILPFYSVYNIFSTFSTISAAMMSATDTSSGLKMASLNFFFSCRPMK